MYGRGSVRGASGRECGVAGEKGVRQGVRRRRREGRLTGRAASAARRVCGGVAAAGRRAASASVRASGRACGVGVRQGIRQGVRAASAAGRASGRVCGGGGGKGVRQGVRAAAAASVIGRAGACGQISVQRSWVPVFFRRGKMVGLVRSRISPTTLIIALNFVDQMVQILRICPSGLFNSSGEVVIIRPSACGQGSLDSSHSGSSL